MYTGNYSLQLGFQTKSIDGYQQTYFWKLYYNFND